MLLSSDRDFGFRGVPLSTSALPTVIKHPFDELTVEARLKALILIEAFDIDDSEAIQAALAMIRRPENSENIVDCLAVSGRKSFGIKMGSGCCL